MSKYLIEQWDIHKFKANRVLWTELLHSSNSDPLFSSWEWQYTWWAEFKSTNKNLNIYAVYIDGVLVAIAPLFTYKTKLKNILPITRCQFIGCSYGLEDLNRSDNLDIIIKKSANNEEIYQQLLLILNNFTWDEFIIDSASKHSHIWQLSKSNAKNIKIYIHKKIYNYIIKLDNDFEWYTKKLKKKIRQKAILHRRFIEQSHKKNSKIKTVLGDDNHAYFFAELNRLKKIRWGKPVYDKNRLAFQTQFIQHCQNNKHLKVTSTLLCIENENQSAFHSITTKDQTYFLQFAFNPHYNSKLSLGYIHLGYVIERSYEANISQIQLLPGRGQSKGYKHHLTNKIQPQLTYKLIKGKFLSLLQSKNKVSL